MDTKNTLFSPINREVITIQSNSVVEFLNILEGFKTRIKNLHWSAFGMNIHEQLDSLLDIVNDYQDALAEGYMGIKGQLGPNELNGIPCNCSEPIGLLDNLVDKTNHFYSSLQDGGSFVGIKSETETFIYNLTKQQYLFKLCKG